MNIIIIGASGFAKEVAWLAEECGAQIEGFLDDSIEVGTEVYGYKVLGTIEQYVKYDNFNFIIGIGSPRIRKVIADKMKGAKFATLIEPSVKLSKAVKVGSGSVICAGNIITTDIEIGKHCQLNLSCTIGHDTIIGDFSTIAPQSVISGNVIINEGVEVGTGSAIRQGSSLEKGSMLGMGSVLTKNMEANSIYLGSPAKFFKQIEDF